MQVTWPRLPAVYSRDVLTVKGGFPVIAAWMVCQPEPDVGAMLPTIEDIQLFTLKGRRAAFIERRMSAADYERLEAELLTLSH